ncbi:MAG: hypothetical protein RLZZ241_724 [Bacteroidota bacterium]
MVFGQSILRKASISEIAGLKSVSEVQVSPDGDWIAYSLQIVDTLKDTHNSQIWMAATQGRTLLPMTAISESSSAPKWSPDGKFLTFLSARGAHAKTQVWTLNRMGGEAQQVTNIPQGVLGYEWSPDGKRLLLCLRDPKPEDIADPKKEEHKLQPVVIDRLQFKQDYVGYLDRNRTHLYSYTPGDSTAIQLTFGDFDDTNPTWSPDGKFIAFESNRTSDPDSNSNTDIWLISAHPDSTKQNPKRITTNENSDSNPAWSPDSKWITYTAVTDKAAMWYATQKLAIVDVTGGTPAYPAEFLDRNCMSPKFSADGKSIYFLLEDNGRQILASVAASGKSFKRVIAGDLVISEFDVQKNRIGLRLENSTTPAEIFTWESESLKRLTYTNAELLTQLHKPIVERITYPSADGTVVSGFVVKPADFKPQTRYPTILWLHGGPVSQYDHSFHEPSQVFAANGYITLLLNPRGSSGYGQAFSQAIFADWGNKDFQDVMAGIDYAIASGYTDPERLGVGGWSYGGILTNYVITKSDRFKAAVSGASEALYRSNYGHDHYQLTWEQELGLPWENASAWERISPFNNVAKIVTPTLWMGGSEDWNVPILNSEQMYQAMKRLGRETQLVVYPGEHHGIRRPSFQRDRMQRWISWFDKYLK